MKVIKLDKRYRLYSRGFKWALKFEGWTTEARDTCKKVSEFENVRHCENQHFGKLGKHRSGQIRRREFYLGIRNEQTLTMVMLGLK